jgi:hypothetical protein
VAPIVTAVSGLIYAIKANAGAAPPTGSVAAPPPAPAPVAFNPYDATAMREYVNAQRAAAQPSASGPPPAAGPASPAAAGAPQPPPAAAQGPMPPGGDGMQQLAALVTTALSCLNRGVDGREASESIISLNGDLAYASICDQVKSAGVPVVLELAKSIPEISGQVIAYEARLKVFIAEFLEGPQWNDDEEAKPNLN